MENYNYSDAVRSDILDWLEDNHSLYMDADDARDSCELTVTGNDNGSYTCSSYQAAEYVRPFIWGSEWDAFTDYVTDELGMDMGKAMQDAETLDVYVRFYYFGQVWQELVDDIEDWGDLDVAELRKAA
ncbi:hypothetical protein [Bifidobacterium sp. SO1]|uniref:hypothetical protein n=1 Tax=Bifidobacterium sp. SO1 TaxID=2809029 RepID=UPI001BDBB295|nr:hypothetical protein [Bifidobacterium sp. SO1]MBT1161229.1 hypothetical protein [Bifidobacterium sp. SO1]